jgi:hypothetical protein
MVIYIKLGEGKALKFEEKNLNVRELFGPYAVLLDKHKNEIPLKVRSAPMQF